MKKEGINWEALCRTGRTQNRGCRGCYYATADLFCTYILKEGTKRPCPMNEGGGCACKLTAKKAPVATPDSREALFSARYLFSARQRRQMKHLMDYPDVADEKRIAELYNRKMSDLQIALAMKCSKQSVYLWRQKNGLKSNFTPER